MRRRWSLAGRLVRRIVPVVAIGWTLSMGIGFLSLAHEIQETMDAGLALRARSALALVQAGSPVDSIRLDEGYVLRVPGEDAPWAPGDGALRRDGDWVVARVSDGAAALEIGQPKRIRREELMESAMAFALVMVPLMLVVLATVVFTTRHALAPARALARTLSGRSATDLSPLPPGGLPDELRPIPVAMNRYLSRIGRMIRAERAFVANAAHEMRTPLAVARARAQSAAAGAGDVAEVDTALAPLARLVERLLQLARAEAAAMPELQPVDLVPFLKLVLEDAPGPVIFDDGDLERCVVPSDPDLLAILLRNLLANACEHGAGPVRLLLRSDGLRIENPVGPGAALHPERFAKRPGSAGSGLGLAIVAAVATQLGLKVETRIADGRALADIAFANVAEAGAA